MRIVLISDIHDHIDRLLDALTQAEALQCSRLLCMGDLAGLAMLRILRNKWPHDIDIVFGNNEYDRHSFLNLAQQMERIRHHGDEGDMELAGRRIFITHYPQAAARALNTDRYHAIFFGHTHIAEKQTIRHTLIANPGEIAGIRAPASFGVYDTEENSVQIFYI